MLTHAPLQIFRWTSTHEMKTDKVLVINHRAKYFNGKYYLHACIIEFMVNSVEIAFNVTYIYKR